MIDEIDAEVCYYHWLGPQDDKHTVGKWYHPIDKVISTYIHMTCIYVATK